MSFISLILCNFWFSTVFRPFFDIKMRNKAFKKTFHEVVLMVFFVRFGEQSILSLSFFRLLSIEKKAITKQTKEKKMGMLLYNRLVLRANACLQTIRIIQLSSILFIDFDYENLWQCMFSVHCSYIVITKKKKPTRSNCFGYEMFRTWVFFRLSVAGCYLHCESSYIISNQKLCLFVQFVHWNDRFFSQQWWQVAFDQLKFGFDLDLWKFCEIVLCLISTEIGEWREFLCNAIFVLMFL